MTGNPSRTSRTSSTKANGNGGHHVSPDASFPLVLVCEDDRRDLRKLTALLKRHGFRVVETKSYDEAKAQLDGVTFAAVVADLRLGTHLDGGDLLRYAQGVQPLAIRVIFTADTLGALLAESVGGFWVSKETDMAATLPRVLKEALAKLNSPR